MKWKQYVEKIGTEAGIIEMEDIQKDPIGRFG